ncbi:hypothetical protein C8D87_114133 [Lentzea atacamensis]|uniref:Uncharacterized protein n=1 Tax=Lentzea atacamensis TaxID=531938 RepID=A0ABX9DW48_9PSEU|nr:hypothetical protein [Lentzea atacamensis]RAS59521.1 hypothetical protein C8D87_114133 [Lentzea atacamensis]
MAEPKQRVRRSTRVSRRLEELRKRNSAQLAEQRLKEERVDEALAMFVEADDRITAAEAERDRRIAPHERAIAALHEQFQRDSAVQDVVKGRAALAIHESDRTVEQVAELLGVPERRARHLITIGRKAAAEDQPAQQTPATTDGAEAAQPQETSTKSTPGAADGRSEATARDDGAAADAFSA